jgi:hypothetical protein
MTSVIHGGRHADVILPVQATDLAGMKLFLWLKAEVAFWS